MHVLTFPPFAQRFIIMSGPTPRISGPARPQDDRTTVVGSGESPLLGFFSVCQPNPIHERNTMSSNSFSPGGTSFLRLLLILFISLKLCGVINWPWWWGLSPFLIPVLILIIGLFVYFVFLCLRSWMR